LLFTRLLPHGHKSSEEGLEQDFNSLHAQREACEAFIRSQRGEGWKLHKSRYDDGGLSGATMELPALKRLVGGIGSRVALRVDQIGNARVGAKYNARMFAKCGKFEFTPLFPRSRVLRCAI
jgi:hypothetical protein